MRSRRGRLSDALLLSGVLLLTLFASPAVAQDTVTAVGNFQSEVGCTQDWDPACSLTDMQDPDGDGIYTYATTALPAGNYEAKVAHDGSWDENYGAGGTRNGANIPFTVTQAGSQVLFIYDIATHIMVVVEGPNSNQDCKDGLGPLTKKDCKDLVKGKT